MNKNKGPKALVPPQAKKPHQEFDQDWRHMKPAWRVSLLEMVDPFGWHTVNPEDAQTVRNRLASFESMYWKEIVGKHSHLIPADKICDGARNRLAALRQDDIDSVMSLRVTGPARVWGIMEHNVMKVLWWDPDHLVYPIDQD